MTPPNKWLFFPAPAATGYKLELDFTLAASGNNRFNGSSPTWSGSDAGSPTLNYALNTYLLRFNDDRVFLRIKINSSGDYANGGVWRTANATAFASGGSIVYTNENGDVLPHEGATLAIAAAHLGFMQFNTNVTDGGDWWDSLSVGDTCNIKFDW